jgi:hypothetical protein
MRITTVRDKAFASADPRVEMGCRRRLAASEDPGTAAGLFFRWPTVVLPLASVSLAIAVLAARNYRLRSLVR